jgi:hypothetical protein
MRSLVLLAPALAVAPFSPPVHAVDNHVIRVRLPDEHIVVGYVEGDPFTVRLQAKNASVEGVSFYVGNGGIAVELRAHPSQGLVFQGELIDPPHEFKKGSTVKVRPGYKQVGDLAPGTVYVELPGVTFEVPGKK